MVFKKGHKPFKKGSTVKKANDVSDIYVKFGVKNDMKNNLSNLSYLISTLKNDLGILNSLREKKAYLRKELYETLIGLRLGIDSLERHLPSKEFEMLKNKIEEIKKYAKKEEKHYEIRPERVIEKPVMPAIKKEKVVKKPEPIIEKKPKVMDYASEKERKELEMLKKDLEEISNQLRSKEK